MSFGDHVSWLARLSSKDGLMSEKEKFINHFSQGTYEIEREEGIVKGTSINVKTGEAERYKRKFDDFVLTRTKEFIQNPISRIIEPIADDNIDAKLEAWLNILTRIKLQIDATDYYDTFPGYKKSISISIKALRDEKKISSNSSSRHGEKEKKAYELQPYLDKIENADSHEQAVAILKKECSKFSWDRPHKKLIFSKNGNLNKSQASYALQKIAEIKWPDTHPLAETIRKALLK